MTQVDYLPKFDKQKVYRKMMVLAWCILLFWVALKIFGGYHIEIVTHNTRFIELANAIDNSYVLKFIIGCASTSVLFYLFWGMNATVDILRHKRTLIICIVSVVVSVAVKLINPVVGLVCDVWMLGGIFFFIPNKGAWCVASSFVYMSIAMAFSVYVKSLSLTEFTTNDTLSALIHTVDYYAIMVLLYLNAKEGNICRGCSPYGWTLRILQSLKNLPQKLKLKATQRKQEKSESVYKSLKLKTRIQIKLTKVYSYTCIFVSIGMYAYFSFNVPQACMLFVCFISLRYLFPTTFHTIPLRCAIISITLFCYFMGNVLDPSISLLSSVAVAFIFDWCLWRWQDYKNVHKAHSEMKDKYNFDTFTHENIALAFKMQKTPAKYRDYLTRVLVDGMRDVDWFSLPENRTGDIDETQYRKYKSKFIKSFKIK